MDKCRKNMVELPNVIDNERLNGSSFYRICRTSNKWTAAMKENFDWNEFCNLDLVKKS